MNDFNQISLGTKFAWNWSCSSGEVKISLCQYIFLFFPFWRSVWPFIRGNHSRMFFCHVWLKIGERVLFNKYLVTTSPWKRTRLLISKITQGRFVQSLEGSVILKIEVKKDIKSTDKENWKLKDKMWLQNHPWTCS